MGFDPHDEEVEALMASKAEAQGQAVGVGRNWYKLLTPYEAVRGRFSDAEWDTMELSEKEAEVQRAKTPAFQDRAPLYDYLAPYPVTRTGALFEVALQDFFTAGWETHVDETWDRERWDATCGECSEPIDRLVIIQKPDRDDLFLDPNIVIYTPPPRIILVSPCAHRVEEVLIKERN